jgi:hypothetical protein
MFSIVDNDKKKSRIKTLVAFTLLLVAGVLFFFFLQTNNPDASNLEEKQQQWKVLLEEKNTIHLHWLRTLNPFIKKTDGDMLWNTDLQKGLMRFVGLPALEKEQYYHLWIFDLQQSQQKPISAGVFRLETKVVDKFYKQITPIRKVKQPYKFLLTIGKKEDTTFSKSQSLLLAQP